RRRDGGDCGRVGPSRLCEPGPDRGGDEMSTTQQLCPHRSAMDVQGGLSPRCPYCQDTNLVEILNALTLDEIGQMWADGIVPGTDLEIDQDAMDASGIDPNDGDTVITT